jgi:dATP pyrophosphohydrolase
VVYTLTGDVLLLRRKSPSDYWQSVTGSLEWGEEPMQAARRELLEETGLDAGDRLVDTGVINTFTIYPEWRKRYAPGVTGNTEYVFTAGFDEKPSIVLNPEEHTAYAWQSRHRAIVILSSETNRAAVRDLLE